MPRNEYVLMQVNRDLVYVNLNEIATFEYRIHLSERTLVKSIKR